MAALAFVLSWAGTASAQPIPNPVGSDEAFRRNVATLFGKDVHFDARFGLWFARMSRTQPYPDPLVIGSQGAEGAVFSGVIDEVNV